MSDMVKYTVRAALEKAMKKAIPIPKRPRTYRLSTPHKPVHWIPSGTFTNKEYRENLIEFATIMKGYQSMLEGAILDRLTARGWCYVLEGLNRLEKGAGFKRCQKAINDCRKLGYLPIDFTAPDQDQTRSFTEVHEIHGIAPPLQMLKDDIERILEIALPHVTTDYWDSEEYYLMMAVEKIDIRNLFRGVCKLFTIPLMNSKGWYTIESRQKIINACKAAEERGLKPVLLLFYDYDIAGLKISDTFRKGLNDLEGAMGWRADNLIIERFGLNHNTITEYGLMWIDNLKSGSGKDPNWDSRHVKHYMDTLAELERKALGISDEQWSQTPVYERREYGKRKCEANALVKDKETMELGQLICLEAIQKYYGEDAIDRFKEKREKSKESFPDVYDNEAWTIFTKSLDELIEKYSEPPDLLPKGVILPPETPPEVELDGKYHSRCPICGIRFNYDNTFINRYVRCRHCRTLMLLKKADSWAIPDPR